MKALLALILFVVLSATLGVASAEGVVVGPGCTLTWTPAATGGTPDGYKIFVGTSATLKTQRADIKAPTTTTTCSAVGAKDGQNYAHVVAYNPGGEAASVTVPFFIADTPGAPINIIIANPPK